MNEEVLIVQPRRQSTWKVGKWREYADLPWYAHERGAWFGKGLPGASFATHGEAIAYVSRVWRAIEEAKSG